MIAIAAILIANNQYNQKQAYIAQADQEKTTREMEVRNAFDSIEANLVKIRRHEDIIRQNFSNAETTVIPGQKERIQQEIRRIEQLLNENNTLIASLNEQLKDKNSRLAKDDLAIKDLRKRIDEYKQMVEGYIAEKEVLQSQLNAFTVKNQDLEMQVSSLSDTIIKQSDVIKEQDQQLVEKTNELHTAYYAVGTYKSLKDRGILEKEGGFLGINQVKTLASPLDPSQFQKIDTRKVMEIPIQAQRCEIVTDQESSSYELIKNNDIVESIKITDPELFWGITKYLVIVVRESQIDELAGSR